MQESSVFRICPRLPIPPTSVLEDFPWLLTILKTTNLIWKDSLHRSRSVNRGGVQGFMWPQIASGWNDLLNETERMDGAEAILAAGKGGSTAW